MAEASESTKAETVVIHPWISVYRNGCANAIKILVLESQYLSTSVCLRIIWRVCSNKASRASQAEILIQGVWVGPENMHVSQACGCCWSRPHFELQCVRASGLRGKSSPPPSLPTYQDRPLMPGACGTPIHSCGETVKGAIWINKLVVIKSAKKPDQKDQKLLFQMFLVHVPILCFTLCTCVCVCVCVCVCTHAGRAAVRKAEIRCWQPSQALNHWFCCFPPSIFHFAWGLLHSKHSYKVSNLSAWHVNS